MKDFPNYLLANNEHTEAIPSQQHETPQQKQVFRHRRHFKPTVVPSILKGIERQSAIDYVQLKANLTRQLDDFILLDTSQTTVYQPLDIEESSEFNDELLVKPIVESPMQLEPIVSQEDVPVLAKKLPRRFGLNRRLDDLLEDATQNLTYITNRGESSHDE